MKIIKVTKFNDYYDPLEYYGGSDRSIIYHREQVKHTQKFPKLEQALDEFISIFNIDKLKPSWRGWKFYEWDYGCSLGLLGFCGKLYPLFSSGEYFSISIGRLLKSAKEIETWRSENNLDILKKTAEFIGDLNPVLDHADTFLDLKVPSFTYFARQDTLVGLKSDELFTNPCLKDLDFQTIVDSFSAYQQLEQFLGGVLTNNPVIPEPDDKTKLLIHGFGKESFKQTSPGKKYKRRNRS